MHECGQSQPPTWYMLDHKTTQIRWLANTAKLHIRSRVCYNIVAFVVLVWCFRACKCTFLTISIQVICPNTLKCLLCVWAACFHFQSIISKVTLCKNITYYYYSNVIFKLDEYLHTTEDVGSNTYSKLLIF